MACKPSMWAGRPFPCRWSALASIARLISPGSQPWSYRAVRRRTACRSLSSSLDHLCPRGAFLRRLMCLSNALATSYRNGESSRESSLRDGRGRNVEARPFICLGSEPQGQAYFHRDPPPYCRRHRPVFFALRRPTTTEKCKSIPSSALDSPIRPQPPDTASRSYPVWSKIRTVRKYRSSKSRSTGRHALVWLCHRAYNAGP
jgi:hypothetical protein